MRIFVLTKKTILIIAGAAVLLIAALIFLLTAFGGDGPAKATAADMEEDYELEVLAGKHKELPVYSVSREDKKIALTIDAACAAARVRQAEYGRFSGSRFFKTTESHLPQRQQGDSRFPNRKNA